jgi:hypothetical protein
VENFSKNGIILVKTRRLFSYSKHAKFAYSYLLTMFLINDSINLPNSYSYYYTLVTGELAKNIWKFYLNIINKDLGLVTSNHHKSYIYKSSNWGVTVKNVSFQKVEAIYLKNFKTYHFSTNKSTFKKLIILIMALLPINYTSYNTYFNIYNNYIWLNWYLSINPLNNIFYLKVHNY